MDVLTEPSLRKAQRGSSRAGDAAQTLLRMLGDSWGPDLGHRRGQTPSQPQTEPFVTYWHILVAVPGLAEVPGAPSAWGQTC